MSTEQDTGIDEEINKLVDDLSLKTEEDAKHNLALDLKSLSQLHFEDLRSFKVMRRDMIAKREALKTAIRILDKRIEISLAAIKVLQTPS